MARWKDAWNMLVRKLKINRGQSGFRAHYAPATAVLVLTTFAPDAIATNIPFANIVATPSTVSLTITKHVPTVSSSSAQALIPTTRALTLTKFAPTVIRPIRATPVTKALVVTRNAPTITNSSLKVAVPATKALALTRFAPTVTALAPRLVTPATKALTLTKYAPSVGAPKLLIPTTKALTVTRRVPTVTATAHQRLTPIKRSLVVTRRIPTVTVSTITSDFPPSTTLTKPVPPTPPAIPGYLVPTVLAPWGTTITRVSNVNGQRNLYSRTAGWNSNGTRILLGASGAPPCILDGNTYVKLHDLSVLPGYGQWANTDPNKIYGTYTGDNHLYSINPSTATPSLTSEYTFTGYTEVSLGDGEAGLSDDDDTIALMTRSASGNGVLVFDNSSNSIVATRSFGSSRPDNCFISNSGNYVLVYWHNGDGTAINQGLQQYDRNLNWIRQLTSHPRHGDPARMANGTEVWAQNDYGGEFYRMDNGAHTYLFDSLQPFPHNTAFTLGHCSARNTGRNGWVYLSVYDYPNTGSGQLLYGRDQLVAASLDNPGEVQVFGYSYHRNSGSNAADYPTNPFMVPSRDGRKVLFGSEWGDTAPYGAVYAYVAEQL